MADIVNDVPSRPLAATGHLAPGAKIFSMCPTYALDEDLTPVAGCTG
ncbi:hypothetical protein ccbrp13_44180 [Ktedonobacteria bacterium brp13]|nr:hypothetical protein ccbrp13_44180 [Ktedonobacteria bacterium brp13]